MSGFCHCPSPSCPLFGRADRACCPLGLDAVYGYEGPHSPLCLTGVALHRGCGVVSGGWRSPQGWVLLGTCSRAAVVCVMRPARVLNTRWPLLRGTYQCDVVARAGVPHWRASWLALVLRASSGRVAVCVLIGFLFAVVPSPTGGLRPRSSSEAVRDAWRPAKTRAHSALPLSPAAAGALGSASMLPAQGPTLGLYLAGRSGFGLRLGVLWWFGLCGPGLSPIWFSVQSVLQQKPRPAHRG